ncbi:MAG: site-2 protease family protein [Clostridia bacterium]|nr:site-2 protease family protein [Clostridia bacterium]
MGGITFSVHPLFILLGIYYSATGRIFVFLTVTLCALVHELGHSFSASRAGYRLNKITLMPFGAVVQGDTEDLAPKDQIKIALAGPLVNLAVGIFFVAVWWVYPEAYVYTDIAVWTSFSLAFVNLIPATPLDGGRVLCAMLSIKLGKRKALLITRLVGCVLGIALLSLFIASCFYSPNVSLLFFSLFVLFGGLPTKSPARYVKLFSGINLNKLKRGMPFKKQGIDGGATVKKLISILDEDCINEIVVYKNGVESALLDQNDISEIVKNHSLNQSLGEIV